LFLYRSVLEQELEWIEGFERAKRPARLPVVLTPAETRAVLAQLEGAKWLMASLLYGSGLRLTECLRLRVKDLDFGYGQILVRDGKGAKDRVTMLPQALIDRSRRILKTCAPCTGATWERGTERSIFRTPLERKYPRARGMGLAVRFSFAQALRGSAQRRHTPTPSR
jgi:integrase